MRLCGRFHAGTADFSLFTSRGNFSKIRVSFLCRSGAVFGRKGKTTNNPAGTALIVAEGREIARVGTCSPRRAAAVRRLYPAAEVLPVRGNVDTRIRKMLAGEFDALVLAMAGIDRLHIAEAGFCVQRLSVCSCVPAACQGIIALEGACGALVHDEAAGRAARIERACQRALGGDCAGGVGCYFDGETLFAQREGRIISLPYEGERTIQDIAEALL